MQHAIKDPHCSWHAPSIVCGDPKRHSVALTFDDGPSESTSQLLAILNRYHVAATFFQCGSNVHRLPQVTREIASAGHELGNHCYSHPYLCFKSKRYIFRELARTQMAIQRVTGRAPVLFRPPFGARWFSLAEVQHQLGLVIVLWTTMGNDWMRPADRVTERVLQSVRSGSIVCLHDGRRLKSNPDIRSTLTAVGRIVPALQDRGFHFETVTQIISAAMPSLRP